MDLDWKKLVGATAPALATALGGPLAGAAVAALAENLLGGSTGDPVQDEAKIAGMLAGGITPELRAKIVEAETSLKLAAMQMNIEERKIDADLDKSYLIDVADARKFNSGNGDVITIAVFILGAWGMLTGATLWALFAMLTGGIKIADAGIAATVFTLLGSLIGYISNIAQQVVGFFFGSSRGSDRKTTELASAVRDARKGA